ncbi:hypothetical protein, partial [Burkholderia pyrrocinia]|uniref:hypothetical protein n=1 Tax=Burkholderia pyrrocinia TaxID=60550 RepID=UPI001ABB683B
RVLFVISSVPLPALSLAQAPAKPLIRLSKFARPPLIVNPRHSFSDSKGHERGRRMRQERPLSGCLKGRSGSATAMYEASALDSLFASIQGVSH